MLSLGAAVVVAMQVAGTGTTIGVAAALRDGEICVAMPASALAAGMTVTLIHPGPRQTVLQATIDRPVASCEPLEQAMISGPYYLARRPGTKTPAAETLWVAVPGTVGTRELAPGIITVRLSAAYPNAQVRSCTSQEGLHLTVWAGTPLESDRVWHEYYYLGYDLEPSCTDRDVGEGSG